MAYVIPFQMQQLFQNLLSNALKFCKEKEKPVILLSHSIFEYDDVNERQSKKILSIEIADNCIGFSKEHANKVFNVFYRVHDKAKYGGSGLGLSICKKIVENHGGSISVNSIENEGSTFKINLPLTQPILL
jgi:signal transduction histidine kinase